MRPPLAIITFLFLMISFPSFAQEKQPTIKKAKAISFSIGLPLNLEKNTSTLKNSNLKTSPNIELGIGFHKNISLEQKFGYAINYRFLSTNSISLPNDYIADQTFFGNDVPPRNDFQHSFNIRWMYSKRIIQNLLWITELGPSFNIVEFVNFSPKTVMSGDNYDESINLFYVPGFSILNRISLLTGKSFALDLFVNVNLNPKFSYTTIGTQINFGRTNKL